MQKTEPSFKQESSNLGIFLLLFITISSQILAGLLLTLRTERRTLTALSCGAGQVKIRLTRGLLCPAKGEAVHPLKWP